MRFLLVVSLVAGCWTSSTSEPSNPAPVAAPPPAPRTVRMKPREMKKPPSGTQAIVVRVLNLSVAGNIITVGLSAGGNQGVDASWYAEVLDGQTDLPYPGGELEIVTVKPTVTVTRTQLTVQQIQQNSRVRLTPR